METTEGLATTKATEGIETSEQTETAVSETTLATTAETIAAATPTSTPKPSPKPTAATTPSTTATTAETTTAATTTLATEPPTPTPSTYPTEEEMEAYIWNVVVSHRTSAGYGTPTYDQAMTDRAQHASDPATLSGTVDPQIDVHDQVGYQLNGTWDGFATWQEDAAATVNAILTSWEHDMNTTGQTLCGVGVGYELRPSGVYFYKVWICFKEAT